MSKSQQEEAALREELSAGIIMPGHPAAVTRHAGLPGATGPAPVSLSVPRSLNVKQPPSLPTDGASAVGPGSSSSSIATSARTAKGGPSKLVGAGSAGVPVLKAPTKAGQSAGRSSGGSNALGAAVSAFKGTPARTVRYSLPVRVDKPVRSSKVTGKHVVLPSESQLAPLPESDASSDEEGEDAMASSIGGASAESFVAGRRLPFDGDAAQKGWSRPAETAPGQAYRNRSKSSRHTRAPPQIPRMSGPAYHTFERMAPSARLGTALPRVTSYAVGGTLHIPSLIGFLRREHGVRPRLYDECAYVQYFKPLLPGFGKANVRSAPEPRSGSLAPNHESSAS